MDCVLVSYATQADEEEKNECANRKKLTWGMLHRWSNHNLCENYILYVFIENLFRENPTQATFKKSV